MYTMTQVNINKSYKITALKNSTKKLLLSVS